MRPVGNDKDVASNPAATRNLKKGHWVDPSTEGARIVWQVELLILNRRSSQWKTGDVKPN